MSSCTPFPSDNDDVYAMRLLPFSPMKNEDRLDADTHLEFILYIFRYFNMSIGNWTCLIGDNTNTNPVILNK